MEQNQISSTLQDPNHYTLCQAANVVDEVWEKVRHDATEILKTEEALVSLIDEIVLNQSCLGKAIAVRLSRKLAREDMGKEVLFPLIWSIFSADPAIVRSAAADMQAIYDRDAACSSPLEPLLFFKGFAAIQTYRIAHSLWNRNRRSLALYFQSISAEVFGVDIHPAARIGCGILMDHATSVVIGETAIVEDNVSILHEVTLGGTGKTTGDRHPIIRTGVMIGAGTKVIGRVEIGAHSKIGAGSVVLSNIAAKKTAVGVPAQVVGEVVAECPAEHMDQEI